MNEEVPISDLFTLIRNGLTVRNTPELGGIPVTRIETISYGVIDEARVGYAGIEIDQKDNWLLESGDILFSHINSQSHIGKCAIYEGSPSKLLHGMNLLLFRANPSRLVPKFGLHLFRSKSFRRCLEKSIKPSVNQASISIADLKRIRVTVPLLSEQQRIAAILDKAGSLRRKRQDAIRLADKFLRSLFIDMFGDPEKNPESFAKGTIRDLVSSANYGTSEKASEQTGQYPILRMNNITYDGGWDFSSIKYVDLDEASAHKYLTQKGDLLFNRTNSKELVGKTAVYMRDEPMAIAGYLVRVRMNERGNAHYVSGYLNSAHGKRTLEARAKSIVGMANINAQEMQDIPLLLPPIELQDKFASIVGAMQERLRKHHAFSSEAEALHAALSEKFFSQTGERVTELC